MAGMYVELRLSAVDCLIFVWRFVLFVAMFLAKRFCVFPKRQGFTEGNDKHSCNMVSKK